MTNHSRFSDYAWMETGERVNSLKHRLKAIFGSVLWREKVFIFEKSLGAVHKIEAKVKVDVRLVQHDDISKIATSWYENFQIKAKERFKMGHMCFGAFLDEDVVNLKWVAFNEGYLEPSLQRKIRLSSDSAYVYDSITVPRYRGLGISPKVTEMALRHLSKMGIKRVYTLVRHNNFPSLRNVQKGGFRKIGTITYIRILKLRLYQCKGETEEDYNKLRAMFSI